MPINANVTNNPITASVGETKIDVTASSTGTKIDATVSGGIGPTGPAGTTTWAGITDKPLTFTPSTHTHTASAITDFSSAAVAAVTWNTITGKPSAFSPSAHAASHSVSGSDTLTIVSSQVSDFTAAVVAAAPPTTNASLLTSGTLPDARLSSAIARTSDVSSAVAALVNSSPAALDTLGELATALGNDANFSTTVTNALAAKAPLASPTFTGTVSGVTKAMVGLGNVPNTDATARANHTGTQAWSTIVSTPTTLSGYGITDAVASSDSRLTDARTPLSHTHTASAISDFSTAVAAASPEEVVEYTTPGDFPATGNSSLLYIATDNARAYRWVGSQYAEVGPTSLFMQGHTHAASDIVSGTVAAARLPIATAAQAVNGADSVLSTPALVLRQFKNWKLVNLSDHQRDITVSGSTGSVSVESLLLRANNGFTTANATAIYRGWSFETVQYYNTSGQNAGAATANWSWSKPLSFAFRLACGPGFPTTSTARVQFGKKLVTSLGTLDQQGMGIEVRGNTANTNGRLWILAHNGTTLTSTDTGLNLLCAPYYDFLVSSDGAGTVTVAVNDTAYTSSGGPTTDLLNAASGSGVAVEITNGNTSNAEARLYLSRHIWIAAQ